MSICPICRQIVFGKGQEIDGYVLHDLCAERYATTRIRFQARVGRFVCEGCGETGHGRGVERWFRCEYVYSLGGYWHPRCLFCHVQNYSHYPDEWKSIPKPIIVSRM
jgi:hypothetical protein